MVNFVLGSSSPSRLELLNKINIVPDLVFGANIDETPLKKEKPLDYVQRMSGNKATFVQEKYFGSIILCADTIVNYQSKIIQKPKDEEEVIKFLKFYSSKNIKIITSIVLINKEHKKSKKTITTTIQFKNISQRDINEYLKEKVALGKAGGIAIESMMESFIIRIIGSYSNIMGLPLYQTRNMLISAGI